MSKYTLMHMSIGGEPDASAYGQAASICISVMREEILGLAYIPLERGGAYAMNSCNFTSSGDGSCEFYGDSAYGIKEMNSTTSYFM